ncbi:MAG: hypothetical protein QW046_05025 [Candidatus Micrarchaeaceae archaeon]
MANNKDILKLMHEHINNYIRKLIDIYKNDREEFGVDYNYLIKNRKDWENAFVEFELSDPEYVNIPGFYQYYHDIYKDMFIDELVRTLKGRK